MCIVWVKEWVPPLFCLLEAWAFRANRIFWIDDRGGIEDWVGSTIVYCFVFRTSCPPPDLLASFRLSQAWQETEFMDPRDWCFGGWMAECGGSVFCRVVAMGFVLGWVGLSWGVMERGEAEEGIVSGTRESRVSRGMWCLGVEDWLASDSGGGWEGRQRVGDEIWDFERFVVLRGEKEQGIVRVRVEFTYLGFLVTY